MGTSGQRDYLQKSLDIAIRLSVIAFIVFGSFRIFSPFLVTVIWAVVIAITAHPFFNWIRRSVGGRAKLACAIFILLALTVVAVPTLLLSNSLLDATLGIVKKAQAGTLVIPPPTEKVKDWPIVGARVHEVWQGASVDLEGTLAKLQPQVRRLGETIISGVTDIGKALMQTLLALIIAPIMMMKADAASATVRAVARRLAGGKGPPMIEMAVGTVRSVVKGVVLVAVAQGLLAAIGLVVAGVPGVGLWSLLVMVLGVMQLPSLLVMAPAAAWVFANNDSTGIAIFFAAWTLLVSSSDNVLKPLLLGRGVPIPMLIILIGAIGGMLRSGLIGLFIGPVVLAIFHQLFMTWVQEPEARAEAPGGEV
jgi:predicted PurR-regulated permease PerM